MDDPAVWVGFIGVVLGGLLGFATHAYVHRSERKHAIAERSRAERRDAYAAWLTSVEDALHRFEWLADGYVPPELHDQEVKEALYLYDKEVTPRYVVLKIIAPEVEKAAHDLREALILVRKPFKRGNIPAKAEWYKAHAGYRDARDSFIAAAIESLEHPDAAAREARRSRWWRRILRREALPVPAHERRLGKRRQ